MSATDRRAGWDDMSRAMESALSDFVSGDATAFRGQWSREDDVVVMGGFGGYETGSEAVQNRLDWAARQYGHGEITVDEVATFIGRDLACTVTIERSSGIGGDPARTMDLRVTQVFRLEDGRWRVVHRHADPLRPTSGPS